MIRPIPYYDANGNPRGFRTLEACKNLISRGLVTGVYGRKGHLKAIHACQADGASSVDENLPIGTRYSFRQHLESGNAVWALKKLGKGNELRPIFTQVVADCLVSK